MTNKLTLRDVLALVGLSFFSGLFAALLAFVVAIVAKWERPLTWSGVVFVVVAAYAWLWLVRRWHSEKPGELSTIVEKLPTSDRVRVDLIDKSDPPYYNGMFLDLPGDRRTLAKLGAQLIEGGDFSMAALSGPHKLFSRSEFENLRSAFLRGGLVKWRNENAHAQGMQLTSKGKACVRVFASWSERPPSLQPYPGLGWQQNAERYAGARVRASDFDYSHYDHAELK